MDTQLRFIDFCDFAPNTNQLFLEDNKALTITFR